MVSNPCTALEDVIETGCNRLLTSGLDSTALEGLDILQILVEKVLTSSLLDCPHTQKKVVTDPKTDQIYVLIC